MFTIDSAAPAWAVIQGNRVPLPDQKAVRAARKTTTNEPNPFAGLAVSLGLAEGVDAQLGGIFSRDSVARRAALRGAYQTALAAVAQSGLAAAVSEAKRIMADPDLLPERKTPLALEKLQSCVPAIEKGFIRAFESKRGDFESAASQLRAAVAPGVPKGDGDIFRAAFRENEVRAEFRALTGPARLMFIENLGKTGSLEALHALVTSPCPILAAEEVGLIDHAVGEALRNAGGDFVIEQAEDAANDFVELGAALDAVAAILAKAPAASFGVRGELRFSGLAFRVAAVEHVRAVAGSLPGLTLE